jgi:hypothetical protein
MKDHIDLLKLSNYQLFEIIQNTSLDKELRNSANAEFNSRNLTTNEIDDIIALHDSQFKTVSQGLQPWFKLLLILLPIFPIQIFFAGQFLVRGERKKWKQYWFFLSIGYLFWTIVIILCFKYFVIKS